MSETGLSLITFLSIESASTQLKIQEPTTQGTLGQIIQFVSAKIRIQQRVEQQNECIKTKFYFEKLNANEKLPTKFTISVRNRFNALKEECTE
jgi:hypothetical protein